MSETIEVFLAGGITAVINFDYSLTEEGPEIVIKEIKAFDQDDTQIIDEEILAESTDLAIEEIFERIASRHGDRNPIDHKYN